jgi:hypothetical protein
MKKRCQELLIKLTSVKGVVFIISTVLLTLGKIDAYWWSAFAAGFIGTRFLEKLIGVRRGE